ncbi:uncharacterized protein LOC129966874 isoform X2 [Argiope bruennichi]|nr:uncharacterized protein LOC129966874 isoform X2 [Argiope bruennichi]XP_055937454.1 uncharacterized protein LOC129966874 isoform X2 [Argiope bruennichi]
MDAPSQNMIQHKYGRDYLLQLRLHPFSLQKPDNLKNHDIVKEKLYLHQLNFGNGSQNTHLSQPCTYPDFPMPLKDPENILRYHHSIPNCYSRNCSSYITGRKCNTGIHVKPSSKSRQLYIPDYVNSIQKLQFQNSSDFEDFLHDDIYCSNAPWLKQCCSFSEETWNCRNQRSDHESSSKSSFESSSRSKKKPLPIIDPKNGKNILDGICEVSTTQESITSDSNDGDSGAKSGSTLISEIDKQPDHDECTLSATDNNGIETITQNLSNIDCSSQSQISSCSYQNPSCKDDRICDDDGNNIMATFKDENIAFKSDFDVNLKKAAEKSIDNGIPIKEMLDSDYEFYKKIPSRSYYGPRISDSFESLEENSSKDVHGDCPFQKKITTDRNKTMTIQESGMKLEDELKVNIKLLREKIYSVKQEQQKMAILQSFLHFKKHQLDEGYRRMDDKKIEIANWECSLANRAKRLLEKECRLEAKRLNLLDKESKLDEREKMLNENRKCTETKFQQDNETVEEIVEEINSESKMKYPEKTFSVDYEFGDTPEVKI